MTALLDQLMREARVWQASRRLDVIVATESSGYPALDQALTGKGWPRGALSELLHPQPGSGELALLLPLIRRLSQQAIPLLWIDPPHTPYIPALQREGVCTQQIMLVHTRSDADFLWAFEQGLRSGVCGLVIGWSDRLKPASLRRLQLAAESSDGIAIILRGTSFRDANSPAALRLLLTPAARSLQIEVIKRRGGWATGSPIRLMPEQLCHWHPLPPAGEEPINQNSAVISGPWPGKTG